MWYDFKLLNILQMEKIYQDSKKKDWWLPSVGVRESKWVEHSDI